MYRILSQGCLERLELDIGKLIRPVLRGGVDDNAAPLPDSMRLTVLQQTAKGLPEVIDAEDGEEPYALREPVLKGLESTIWYLWHGNVFQALQEIESIIMDLDAASAETADATVRKLLKAVEEFQTYVERNAGFIPNYGERWRSGERISTGFVESTVNQVISKRMVKKQQMVRHEVAERNERMAQRLVALSCVPGMG